MSIGVVAAIVELIDGVLIRKDGVSIGVVVAVDVLIEVVSMVVKGSLLSRFKYRSDESPEKTLTDIVVR